MSKKVKICCCFVEEVQLKKLCERVFTVSIGGGLDEDGVVVCGFCTIVVGLCSVSVRSGIFGGVVGACP